MGKDLMPKSWRDFPKGIHIKVEDKPQAFEYITAGWRTFRPEVNLDKCVHCMMCWLVCPDNAVVVKDGKMTGFFYDHCKGCGVCANECPVNAIEMVPEVR